MGAQADRLRTPESPLSRVLLVAAATVAVACLAIALFGDALWGLAGLMAVPLAVATFASVKATALAAATTLAAVLLVGLSGDEFGGAHIAALVAGALGGAMAVAIAVDFARRARSASYSAYLGEATTLLTCSLDFDETAKAAASVPVPQLADWSLVELFDGSGTIERRAASHADERAEEVARALVESDPDAAHGPLARVWSDLPEPLRASGACAAIRVPLRTPERRLGVMTLIAVAPRRYGEDDLTRAEELAARASMAIENAQLYRAASRREQRRFGRRAEPPIGRPEPRTSE
jgi:GAF domain-containing protein